MKRLSMQVTSDKGQRLTLIKSAPLVLLIALTPACSNNRYFQQEVATVQQRLQEQSNYVEQAPERDGNSLRTSWEFQSQRPAAGFLDWAASQLGHDYHETSRTASTADFAKEAPGDDVYLRLKVSPSPAGSLVECALQAMPD